MPILLKLSKETRKKGILSMSLMEASITLIPRSENNSTEKENYKPVSLMNIDANSLSASSMRYWQRECNES